jgi:hypothetical protein
MIKYVWRYWFAGMKKPSKLPKGCQNRSDTRLEWVKEDEQPHNWILNPRRWKVALKTCKWTVDKNEVYKNDHMHYYPWKCEYCPTCGKPVEIVKNKQSKGGENK